MGCQVKFNAAQYTNRCDVCNAELIRRDDDRKETIRHSMSVYYEQKTPLIGYYGEQGLLFSVDGIEAVSEVQNKIFAILSDLR